MPAFKKTLLLGTLVLLPLALLAADRHHPGFVDLTRIKGFENQQAIVEVKLDGWLLGLAQRAAEESEDDDARILSQIESINVRIFESGEHELAARSGDELVAELLGQGWEQFTTVRDQLNRVYVLVRGSADRIDGITVVAWDEGEGAVLVNIAGALRPEDIARIIDNKSLIHADIDIDV